MKARIVYEDRREEIVDVLLSGDGNVQVCTLPKERMNLARADALRSPMT